MNDILIHAYSWIYAGFDSIFLNIVSSVITFFCGIVFASFTNNIITSAKYFKMKKVFGRFKKMSIITGIKKENIQDNSTVRINDFHSIINLMCFIRDKYPTTNCEVFNKDSELDSTILNNANIILIGGPNKNKYTKAMFSGLKTNGTLLVKFDGYKIQNLHTNESWSAVFDKKGEITEDYGMVYGFVNPFNKKYRVLICAGCKGVGTFDAVEWIRTGQIFERIPFTLRRKDSFCFIIKSNVQSGRSGGGCLIAMFIK